MKIAYISDLHIDFNTISIPVNEYIENEIDALIIAGDISNSFLYTETFLEELLNQFNENSSKLVYIIYVPGNHEFYVDTHDNVHRDLISLSTKYHNFVYLSSYSQGLTVGNTTIIGDTLWTDFCLYGINSRQDQMDVASRLMDEFIHGWSDNQTKFKASDSAALHNFAVRNLENRVVEIKKENPDQNIIVVSHHAPSTESIGQRYRFGGAVALNGSFASGILDQYNPSYSEILSDNVDFWIHGHMHHVIDYTLGKTRVLCNPYGYGKENSNNFDFMRIIEV